VSGALRDESASEGGTGIIATGVLRSQDATERRCGRLAQIRQLLRSCLILIVVGRNCLTQKTMIRVRPSDDVPCWLPSRLRPMTGAGHRSSDRVAAFYIHTYMSYIQVQPTNMSLTLLGECCDRSAGSARNSARSRARAHRTGWRPSCSLTAREFMS